MKIFVKLKLDDDWILYKNLFEEEKLEVTIS